MRGFGARFLLVCTLYARFPLIPAPVLVHGMFHKRSLRDGLPPTSVMVPRFWSPPRNGLPSASWPLHELVDPSMANPRALWPLRGYSMSCSTASWPSMTEVRQLSNHFRAKNGCRRPPAPGKSMEPPPVLMPSDAAGVPPLRELGSFIVRFPSRATPL